MIPANGANPTEKSHNSVYVPPSDQQTVEALVRYMTRPPGSLAHLRLLPGKDQVLHFPKAGGDDPGSPQPEQIDAMDYASSSCSSSSLSADIQRPILLALAWSADWMRSAPLSRRAPG